MTTYEQIGSGGFELGGQGEYSVSEPTCNQVYNDLIFFLNKSNEPGIDQVISKRFARAALVFLAFYFESLANLLVGEVGGRFNCLQQLEQIYEKRDHYPKPLRKFQAAYFVIYGKKLPSDIDTSGIQDLFLLRNQVIAHPPARSIINGTDVPKGKGLTENEKPLQLQKFNFPNIYEGFASEHAQEVYNETKDFLENYNGLVAEKLSGATSLYYLKKL